MNKVLLAFVFSQLAITASAMDSRELYAIGKAYQPGTSGLLYVEEHYGDINNDAVQEVLYLDDAQRQIAVKKSIVAPGIYAPEFFQADYRSGQLIAAKPVDGSNIEVMYRAGLNTDQLRDTIEKSANLVMDSGFNTYILDNWESLQSGAELNIEFVVPARMSSIGMTVNATACERDDGQCFSVSPRNFLLKLVVGEIELEYSADKQRLLMFRGVSNISDYSGSGQKVEIHYEYPEQLPAGQELLI